MTIEELKVVISAETSKLTSALKSATQQLSNMSSKVVSTVQRATNKVTDTIKSSIQDVMGSFKKLGYMVKKVFSPIALILFGKKALELASDLEEVQNVVDVAFGDMADEVDEFATKIASAFGLSEKMAKQTASMYMSMGRAMGIDKESAKTMSLQLTALTGDMASFYNVSQEVADTALKSVFTGETESLKRFGIVMTDANLKAYAMSKGLKKSYKNMNQAEKVALRYNYVMEQTALVQNDFSRTSNSWANQLRILKMSWEDLTASMGLALQKVLLPLLSIANYILKSLTSFVNALKEKFNEIMKGVFWENDTDKAVEHFEEQQQAIEDANKAALDYKRTLMGFDELNVLKAPPQEYTVTLPETDLGLDLLEPYDFREHMKQYIDKLDADQDDLATQIYFYLKHLWSVFGVFDTQFVPALNKMLVDGINRALSFDWDVLGFAIGYAINSINHIINGILKGVNFERFGQLLAQTLSSVITTIDWRAIGENAALKINVVADLINGALDQILRDIELYKESGSDLITSIQKMINSFFETLDLDKIKEAMVNVINFIIDFVDELLQGIDITAIVETLLNTLTDIVKNIDWEQVGRVIHDFIIDVLQGIRLAETDGDSLAGQIGLAIRAGLKGLDLRDILSEFFATFDVVLEEFWGGLFDDEEMGGLAATITEIGLAIGALSGPIKGLLGFIAVLNLSGLTKGIGGLAKALSGGLGKAFGFVSGGAATATTDIALLDEGLIASAGATAKTGGIFSKIAGVFTSKGMVIAGAIAAVIGILIHLWNTNEDFKNAVVGIWDDIKGVIQGFFEYLGELKEILSPVFDAFKESGEEIIQSLGDALASLIEALKTILHVLLLPIKGILEFLAPRFKDFIDLIVSFMAPAMKTAGKTISGFFKIIKDLLDFIVNIFTGEWGKAWESVVNIFKHVWEVIKNLAKGIWEAIGNVIDKIKELFHKGDKIAVQGPTYNPGIAGPNFNNYSVAYQSVPQLANGGVLYDSTVVEAGEYAGAKHNPEIVAPQSMMKETMELAMLPFVNAYVAMGNRIVKAIEDKDTDIYMDTTKVTRKISKEQQAQNKNKGTSLVLA